MRGLRSGRRFSLLTGSFLLLALTAGQCGTDTGLDANVAPRLSTVEDQLAPAGESIEVPFAITDEEPDTVSVAASSSDTTLIANADLSVLGAGADRTLRIAPALLGSGSAVITLSAQDAHALEDEVSFVVQVTQPFETELSKLLASDGAAADNFSRSMAIDGNLAVVGAPGDDDYGSDSGSAYVFVRTEQGWVQSAKLPPAPPVVSPTATDLAPGDWFGGSVAISGDYIIVGASGDDEGGSGAGAAYVYKRCTGNFCTRPWTEAGKLTASDAGAGDGFGTSVAISGAYAIVGAPDNDHAGVAAGAAYVFKLSAFSWIEIDKLIAADANDYEFFGASVTVDGDAAIVGAPATKAFSDPGSAYVFGRSGDNWHQVQQFVPDVAGDEGFGTTVDIDGGNAIVGVSYTRDSAKFDFGAAYVLQLGSGGWEQASRLAASDASEAHNFGRHVSIDGDHALIGAAGDNDDAGAAYVFRLGTDGWKQVSKLTASDATAGAAFGSSVAVDGAHALVGAMGDTVGAAYAFLK